MSYKNLLDIFDQADDTDVREGRKAYLNYNSVMQMFAEYYKFPLDLVTAAFVSLSPQNDYFGNLRSLASVLDGYNAWNCNLIHKDQITVSTYNHCRDRALKYISGEEKFVSETRGLKILSFYYNILDPYDMRHVTVDGHMVNAYKGENRIMVDAKVSLKEYKEIADVLQILARERGLVPCQLQAIIWFTRKRLQNIRYNAQLELFGDRGDVWRSIVSPLEALPYPLRS